MKYIVNTIDLIQKMFDKNIITHQEFCEISSIKDPDIQIDALSYILKQKIINILEKDGDVQNF